MKSSSSVLRPELDERAPNQVAVDEFGRLEAFVREQRVRVVGCRADCDGVVGRRPSDGHVPRLVHLERGRPERSGVIVVGMNPGDAEPDEQDVVKAAGEDDVEIAAALYNHLEEYVLDDDRYYKLLRQAVVALNFSGPIFWTEAVKCSSKSKGSLSIPETVTTFSTCGAKFLLAELEAAPASWPIIVTGRDAFVAVCLLAPHRRVLGLPHPTAARTPAFWRVFKRDLPDTLQLSATFVEPVDAWRGTTSGKLMLKAPARAKK